MLTAVKHHLTATVSGTGPAAGLRALHNLYGMSGVEIAFALGRDRTMVSAYLSGSKDMPAQVTSRLADVLKDCQKAAREVKTQSDVEDELLAAIISRTEEIVNSL